MFLSSYTCGWLGAISVGCYVLLGLMEVPIFATGGGIGSPERMLTERKLETFMQEDNYRMIEELTGVSVVATISPNSDRLELTEN